MQSECHAGAAMGAAPTTPDHTLTPRRRAEHERGLGSVGQIGHVEASNNRDTTAHFGTRSLIIFHAGDRSNFPWLRALKGYSRSCGFVTLAPRFRIGAAA